MTDLLARLKSTPCKGAANTASCSCHWGLLKEAATEIEKHLAALRQVDELYSHAWDRTDGGLSMFGSSVPKFETAHKAVREALGIKLLAYEED